MTVMRDALATRDNGLNLLRLVLAALVIVSHSWSVAGFGPEPRIGDLNLGAWAVGGFFAISGYLVSASRLRLTLNQFLLRRALRILPGFWVCLLIVAFAFDPMVARLTSSPYNYARAESFVWANASTLLVQFGIGEELRHVPYPSVWDASLWTLFHELCCYLLAGWALSGRPRRHVVGTCLALYTFTTVFNVTSAHLGVSRGTLPSDFLRLLAYFSAGALLYSLGARVRADWRLSLVSVGLLGIFAMLRMVDLLGALPLAYLVLSFGAFCPVVWGSRRDLSYGVYVYGWPVQQTLVVLGVSHLGPALYILAAMILVMPLAWLSWVLVERPAIRMGRRWSAPSVAPFGEHPPALDVS